jgi:hypothetical protein
VRDGHFVMCARPFAFDEKPIVFRVEDGLLDVVAREASDRVVGLPQRDDDELRSRALDTAEDVDARFPSVPASPATPVSFM